MSEHSCENFMKYTGLWTEDIETHEVTEDTPKIYIKELKPEDNAREVEFALVEVFDDKFEFERQVEKKLNDGWKPIGGVCYKSGNYLMGMMRLK